ncbi:MAG: hypothetical protein HQ461_03140 [Deltaproteobacteria bacterium]|nr:hypothetical protein [Deltaproteobacteria bacterium]
MTAPRHPQSDALRDELLALLRDSYRKLDREQLYRAAEGAMRFGRTGGAVPARTVGPFATGDALQQGFEAEFIHAIAGALPVMTPEQVNLLVGDLVQQFEVVRRSEVSRSSTSLRAMGGAGAAAAEVGAGRSVLEDQRGPSLRSTPDRLRKATSSGNLPALQSPAEPRQGSLSGSYTISNPMPPPAAPSQGGPTVQGTPTMRQSRPSVSVPALGGAAPARPALRPPTRPMGGLQPRPTTPLQTTPGGSAPTEGSAITEGLGAVVLYDDKAGAIEVLPMSQQAEARVRGALAPGRQLRLMLTPAPAPGRDLEIRVEVPWQSRPFLVAARSGPSSQRGTLLEVSRQPQSAAVPAAAKPAAPAPVAAATPAPRNVAAPATARLATFDPNRPRPNTGQLLHASEGAVGPEGPIGTLMRQAVIYPGVVLLLETPAEHWRVTTLEDLLLDIEVAPMRPDLTIEALVTKSGLAEPARLQEALAQHQRTGEPLEQLLTTTGALRFRELDAILATRLRMLFAALATSHPTQFKAEAFDRIEPLASGQTISFAKLAFGRIHDALDKQPPAELEEWGRVTPGFPKPRAELRIPLQRYGIASRELAFLEAEANGDTSIGSLLSKSPVRRHATLVLLATLDRMGYLEWVRHDVAELRAMRAKPQIEQKLSELQQANLFATLDTHWSDYDAVIGEAAKRVINGLDLPYLSEHGPAETQQLARRLTMGLRAVADRLSTRPLREAVRAKLIDDFARSSAVDLYEKQAEMALFKSDWEQADDQLRRILELEPGNRRAAKRLEEVAESRQTEEQTP